jgi:hypothetical protein
LNKDFLLIAAALGALAAFCAYGASVALPPICPLCGNSDSVEVNTEMSEILDMEVYWCPVHGKYYIRDVKGTSYFGFVWRTREQVLETLPEIEKEKAKEETQLEAKIARMESYGWSEKRINRVLEGYIYIGDTPEIVLEAWGRPEDVNRTITAYGTTEQWVYGLGCYVYFEDGKVTAIQD